MGLDIYLFRCQKPRLKDGTFLNKEEFKKYEESFQFFDYDDSEFLDCPTLVNNSVKVQVEQEVYDLRHIAEAICTYNSKDFNLDEFNNRASNVLFTSFSDEHITFEYYNAITKGFLNKEFTNKEIQNYIVTKNVEGFLVGLNQVDYQRKGLNDRGWELMPCDNTGYSDDYEKIEQMVVEGGLSETFLENWEEEETVFHPWW